MTLSVGNLGVLKWYIDGFHNVHWDCKGHEGVLFTMGKGSHFKLFKKSEAEYRKLNRDGIGDSGHVYAQMLWTLYFIQNQGYGAECISLYQDNINTQLLMKSGHFLSSKKTMHIKAKFFFIKDKVDDGEMQVIDCSTKNMWAVMLTKPLQGAAFKKMRAEVMNCSVNYEEKEEEEMSSTTGLLTGR